ncbi:hypothetical protein LCGC14_1307000 [marine sediment metagenome]|uniref:Uncharacterized protein n=1 Tax=marine sediment metagenome TaxID=412755 RepID=A0A0F9KNE5_9ZZZZ|nr:hypothetical protein [bacterium]
MKTQVRQGDILFELVESKDHAFLQLNEDGIVAYGEISGHKHIIHGDGQLYVRPAQQRGYNEEDNRIGYIIANEDINIVHDEHATMPLGKGIYKVSQQREFVHTKELKRYQPPEVKRVQD